MSKRYSKYGLYIVLIGDLLILLSTFWLLFVIAPAAYDLQFKLLFSTFVAINWVTLSKITNLYSVSRTVRVSQLLRKTLETTFLHFLVTNSFFVFFDYEIFPIQKYLLFYAFFVLVIFGFRTSFAYFLRLYRKQGFNYRNVVVIGYGEVTKELEVFFRAHPEHGYKFQGYFDNLNNERNVLGKVKDIYNYAKSNKIDEIYCCLPYVRYTQIKNIIEFGEDNFIKVKLIADFRGFSFKGVDIQRFDHIPVLNITKLPLDHWLNVSIKRSFDILFSLIVIVGILSWLTPLLAFLIKLESKGPVFFKQKRTGKGNNSFNCWKFRSMTINKDSDHVQATKNDMRITRIGQFIRKTSLDELPQFYNVLLGDMSVVGPRPHMLVHTEKYSKLVQKFMSRHFVKPGITGLAQAKGYRGETKTVMAMQNRVKLDRFYVENWSFIFDLKIIFLTVSTMIKGDDQAF